MTRLAFHFKRHIQKAINLFSNFRTAIDFVGGEPIKATRKRLENMRLHRLFATMPRPAGMVDEKQDWVKPAW